MRVIDILKNLVVRLVGEPAADEVARVISHTQARNRLAQFDRSLRVFSQETGFRLKGQPDSGRVGGGEPTAETINLFIERRSDRCGGKSDLCHLQHLGEAAESLEDLQRRAVFEAQADGSHASDLAVLQVEPIWSSGHFRRLDVIGILVHPEFDLVEPDIHEKLARFRKTFVFKTS